MKQPRVVTGTRQELDKAMKAIFSRVPQRSQIDEATDIFERLRATPPKQERSLQTLNRLLDAAEKVLEEDGLDAATVPVIAKRAGVSVGVVYRRFPNKDALIRAVYERFLWRINEQNSMMLSTLNRVQCALPDLLRGMIRGSVEGHRRKRSLLRALHHFARTHSDPTMKREAGKMNRASTAALTALMLTHQDKIKHPDPEAAIQFAVLMLAAVIRAVIIDEEGTYGMTAPDDLEEELTGMIFGYLGIDERR
jgi:AcrR family transcriptional regulator